jgi:glycosyltransferase involved in cell wall biosynthesis
MLVDKDVVLNYGFLTDEDFSNYLHAADYFAYPCRNINNSGSLNAALSAGVPVIVPSMDELNWIPTECKIMFSNQDDEISRKSLSGILRNLPSISGSEYRNLKKFAFQWSGSRTWESVSLQYESFYREIVNE